MSSPFVPQSAVTTFIIKTNGKFVLFWREKKERKVESQYLTLSDQNVRGVKTKKKEKNIILWVCLLPSLSHQGTMVSPGNRSVMTVDCSTGERGGDSPIWYSAGQCWQLSFVDLLGRSFFNDIPGLFIRTGGSLKLLWPQEAQKVKLINLVLGVVQTRDEAGWSWLTNKPRDLSSSLDVMTHSAPLIKISSLIVWFLFLL